MAYEIPGDLHAGVLPGDWDVRSRFRPRFYIDSDSLTVGDKFLLFNTLNNADDYKIEPAPVEGQVGDATVLSDIYRIPDSEPGTIAFACTLAVYKPGEVEIPSFVLNFKD